MIKIAGVYGGIAGLIVITTMITGIMISGEGSLWLGYLVMLVALSMIYFGVKRYRDREQGGVIKFGKAFLMGLSIAAVAGVVYVFVWEIYLASTDHAFIEQYTSAAIEKKEAAGVSGAELQKAIDEMEKMKEQYGNPLFRLPMTFTEIFPVGLIIALISAALLRNPK